MIIQFDKNNLQINEASQGESFYLCFPGLSTYKELIHRVFTRNNGWSRPPYNSLNVSYEVGDDPLSVDRNILSIRQNTGSDRVIYMNQQHGDTVISLKSGFAAAHERVFEADALITDIPGTAIMVKQADCQGIILFDPVTKVVAVVHSGWKGSVKNISGKVVEKMCGDFDVSPENIIAAIGPSLGPCCGEFTTYEEIFPAHFKDFMSGMAHFDLWAITEKQLTDSGVKNEKIEKAGICTRCNTGLFYSYRGEGVTGRFATVAMIKKNQ
ncbi:MAG: peptidoglycan editing factor PgeF [Deltaproteobacteria bacterium]|nr:peptidoglycan editing factor PgeF [Deltaproteobacteria bacterium]